MGDGWASVGEVDWGISLLDVASLLLDPEIAE
jgi:hypothetical protein